MASPFKSHLGPTLANPLSAHGERGPAGIAQTACSSPYEPRLGPVRDMPRQMWTGAQLGIDWASPCPYESNLRTVGVLPTPAHTNPAWDSSGLERDYHGLILGQPVRFVQDLCGLEWADFRLGFARA